MSEPKSGMEWLMKNGPTIGQVLATDLRSIATLLRVQDQRRLAQSADDAAAFFERFTAPL